MALSIRNEFPITEFENPTNTPYGYQPWRYQRPAPRRPAVQPQAILDEPTTATAPTTVTGFMGQLFPNLHRSFNQGGMKGGLAFVLDKTAQNTAKALTTGRANYNTLSAGEKLSMWGDTVGNIMNALNSRKQLKLSHRALGHQMAVDNKNYDMARKQWNHKLEDKARYREAVAKDQGRSYMTVGDMMAKYGA